jgi:hypothetical protein
MPNLCEKYEFTVLPRHYHNTKVFTEMPRHLRKCQNYDITANIYKLVPNTIDNHAHPWPMPALGKTASDS